MIKVSFYTNDDLKNKIRADFQFRSFDCFDRFVETYQHLPGYRIFEYDIWDTSVDGFGLRTLGANDKSFIRVALALGLKVREDF